MLGLVGRERMVVLLVGRRLVEVSRGLFRVVWSQLSGRYWMMKVSQFTGM